MKQIILVALLAGMCGCAGGRASQGVLASGGGYGGAGASPYGSNAATIAARQYVTRTVHIAGGHLTAPYVANTPNCEYILDADISADSTAIVIGASYVIINLNGHTIRYNQVSPGDGIRTVNYNFHDVGIINGRIIQGRAQSSGAAYGLGNNPIQTKYCGVTRLQVADISAQYGGKDVAGFHLGGDYVTVEKCTVEDTYRYGTVIDRHVGNAAIKCWGSFSTIRNNTIITTRQQGIASNYSTLAEGNVIGIRSICTNSIGISVGANSTIRNNAITGVGEHPIGIEVGSSTPKGFSNDPAEVDPTYVPMDAAHLDGYVHDVEIYGNTIDVRVTGLGTEYAGGAYPGPATWVRGDNAVGIRSTTGIVNLNAHDNTITVHSDANFIGTWSPTGEPVTMGAGARGLMLGLRWNDHSATFSNNTIVANDKDGTGYAVGIAVDANIDNRYWYADRSAARRPDFHPDLRIYGNTVTSNGMNLSLCDEYGPADGFPLIYRNTFIKSGEFASYVTSGTGYGCYDHATGILLSNSYRNGSAENNFNFNFDALSDRNSYRGRAIIFGRLMAGTVKDAGNRPLPNIRTTVYPGAVSSFGVQLTSVSDSAGAAPLYVYDYELNNAGGTSGKAAPVKVVYRPHTVSLYDAAAKRSMFTTNADPSPAAWDHVSSSGTFVLTGAGGSVTIAN
ncbi:hypothetical protein FO488_11140 [Geobacter sp. FeAm09]|uniref:hypothetical protein n=1 Tax=Geobacter sp. FeAm09 TaxID=2597769 RepID=UPI0011F04490|nr:hypothetical protein [Geobacter sp. FeAm09]QEM68658.1 hypothetical protein FO488_11140 [Geobacter sp. FeAm09]